MAAKTYVIGEEASGLEWAQALTMNYALAPGDEVEMELEDQQETAVLAAGWLLEPKGKKGDK